MRRQSYYLPLRFLLAGLVMAVLGAGCTEPVVLTDGGAKVQIVDKLENPDACKKLVNVMDVNATRDDPLGTYPEEIKMDVEHTARNKAAELGATVIVPRGGIENGKQSFDVYACPAP